MAKRLLIIDNEDVTETISHIEVLALKKGFTIECYPFYIGLPDGNKVVDDAGKIDIDLVKKELVRTYGSLRFHMVASDFRLNDDNVDGVEIIRQLSAIANTQKATKILYSSELIEIVQEYLDIYKRDDNFAKSWQSFRTLIKLDILDFSKRETIEQCIVNYIEKISEQEDDFIVDELLANTDISFNPLIGIYDGLTFHEIAERINNNDSQALKFKKKLINLAISQFASLKNE